MKRIFSNLIQILIGFLYFITIMAKPMYHDSSLLMPQESEYQSPIQGPLRMPPINLNIIVVPIVREDKSEEKLVDYINNRMELPGNRMNEKLVATANTVVTESMKPVTERLVDLSPIYSSNEIDNSVDNKTPAPGIIQPQAERPQSSKPKCQSSEVYDSGLGQCIRRRSGACPLCGRRMG